MIPASFSYRRAESLDDALRWLAEDPQGSKLVAGGHSLLPLMKMRLAAPRRLIDIARVSELIGIREQSGAIVIGAGTVHRDLAGHPDVRQKLPALAEAAGKIGDLQVRNRGTIGGSLSHADPSADLPAALMALAATVDIAGPAGERSLAVEEMMVAPLVTGLAPDEVLVRVRVPIPAAGSRSVYLKHPHPASGYALAGVAVAVTLEPAGAVTAARVAVTGAGVVPFRATDAETVLIGDRLTPARIAEAAKAAAAAGEFAGDALMSAEYRRQLCRVYVERAISALVD
ncbi:MAG: xanthine dehydrogenase family protein subunit M [Thermaerobacter sp.]|nr:xanthine dehydrogenase family protein subunit M [Thermaerobacter sp.]